MHAVYLSTFNVAVDAREITTEIRVFEDDLRDVIRDFHGTYIDTSSQLFVEKVGEYFNEHAIIKGDHYKIEFEVYELTRAGDSYRIKCRGATPTPAKSLEFAVDYFLELFPTQQNVLNLTNGDQRWYYIFKKGKEQLIIPLNS